MAMEGTVSISYATGRNHKRIVTDIVKIPEFNIETGCVEFSYHYVPVWRGLDKNGHSRPEYYGYSHGDPGWLEDQLSIWKNIYTINLVQGQHERNYLVCDRKAIGNGDIKLPVVKLTYSRSFLSHLESKGVDTKKLKLHKL